ncbi:hypothetical protein JTE90_026809 [Oedothorax gibbosus]|uniref:Uncharacterized protein n=1 Tax=Oedothorax gibbosus TaxID=931172 RepID=A0AAV6V589_9ARAC|nr:hypothetical protein JTE90_026809 [Oedothorax gibbosus]
MLNCLRVSTLRAMSRPPTPYPVFRKKGPPQQQPEAKKAEEKNEVVEYCKDMLQKSMLTGVPQIVSAPTTRSKVFKTFVVMGSFTGFLYQTSAFLVIYFSYPTLVDVQVTTPPFVDVPSLTICNRNGLRRRVYCNLKPENCSVIDIPLDFCEKYPETCKNGDLIGGNMFPKEEALSDEVSATQEMVEEVGHPVFPLVSSCDFTSINVTFDFCRNTTYKSFIFQDLYGRKNKCYIVNALWSKASLNLGRVPTRARLEMTVDLEPDEYFSLDRTVSGQVAIHSPWNILNPFSEGFSIQPGKMYIIKLEEHIKNLLPRPYQTNCTDYIETWKSRGLNGPLSKEMCIEECILNQTMDICQCVLPNNLYPHNFKFCGKNLDVQRERKNNLRNNCHFSK